MRAIVSLAQLAFLGHAMADLSISAAVFPVFTKTSKLEISL
jgi:hypothetical protein